MNVRSQKKRQQPSQATIIQSAPDLTAISAMTTDRQLQRAKTAPNQQAQWSSHPLGFSSPNPPIDPPFRGDSRDLFSPVSAGGTHRQNPDNSMYLHTPTSHGVPDLSAMMFPSADPFAYPNQPMITLENRSYIKQEPPISQAVFDPPTTTGYEGVGGQSFDQVPGYSILSPGQDGGFSMPPPGSMNLSGTDAGSNAMVMSQGGPEWEPHQQTQRETQGMGLGQLYGEDWGGWMNQGYRQ